MTAASQDATTPTKMEATTMEVNISRTDALQPIVALTSRASPYEEAYCENNYAAGIIPSLVAKTTAATLQVVSS